MSITLRTALLPILATALVCQPRLAPEERNTLLRTTVQARAVAQVVIGQALKMTGLLLSRLEMTRKP